MNDKNVMSFKVYIPEEGYTEWLSTDTEKFTWGCGPAGDLMIFRSEYHAAFSARLSEDERWYCYAPGTWESVEVIKDEVEEATELTVVPS